MKYKSISEVNNIDPKQNEQLTEQGYQNEYVTEQGNQNEQLQDTENLEVPLSTFNKTVLPLPTVENVDELKLTNALTDESLPNNIQQDNKLVDNMKANSISTNEYNELEAKHSNLQNDYKAAIEIVNELKTQNSLLQNKIQEHQSEKLNETLKLKSNQIGNNLKNNDLVNYKNEVILQRNQQILLKNALSNKKTKNQELSTNLMKQNTIIDNLRREKQLNNKNNLNHIKNIISAEVPEANKINTQNTKNCLNISQNNNFSTNKINDHL